MKKNITSICSISLIALFGCICYTAIVSFTLPHQSDTTASKPFRVRTIVIDAGHGGKDPGAHGSYSLEKDVALAVAKKVQALLNDDMPEITVIMTRTTDKFIPLNERSEIANRNNANLFISIHCN